ncbi:hypothetical protein HZ326_0026 [Fusarium oxysporum f. sp. albedinis]|nr:hypothetical protein HZ326_0026 [Fusarium oxysporum f. sp. albedinis]
MPHNHSFGHTAIGFESGDCLRWRLMRAVHPPLALPEWMPVDGSLSGRPSWPEQPAPSQVRSGLSLRCR